VGAENEFFGTKPQRKCMNQQRVINNQQVALLARKLTIIGKKKVKQVNLAEKK